MSKWSPVLLSILRIVSGFTFIQHGTEKILGFPHGITHGGPAPEGIMGTLMQSSGYIELIGGALILLGLLTRPAAFILSGEMAVAYFTVHAHKGFWLYPADNGGEAAVLYCFLFLYLAFAGAGPISIDKMRGKV